MLREFKQITQKEPLTRRIILIIEDIWPTIYRILNSLFFGIINFLKDLVSGLWR
jgi:hypothetical protein